MTNEIKPQNGDKVSITYLSGEKEKFEVCYDPWEEELSTISLYDFSFWTYPLKLYKNTSQDEYKNIVITRKGDVIKELRSK